LVAFSCRRAWLWCSQSKLARDSRRILSNSTWTRGGRRRRRRREEEEEEEEEVIPPKV
jgi:hypothetical protein